MALNTAPPTIVFCMDQHQVQWCAFYYLTLGKPGLCSVAVMDHNHRRSNDVWDAIRAAGRAADIIHCLLWQNISYGPWQKGQWGRELQAAALDCSKTLKPNDPLLLRLWKEICLERNFESEDQCGEAARAEFLKELPECPAILHKGPKSSVSRWFSWNSAMKFQMPHHHTKLLVGVFLGVQKGWWKHYSELWGSISTTADSASPAGTSTASSSSKSSGAASSSSGSASSSAASSSSAGPAVGAASSGSSGSADGAKEYIQHPRYGLQACLECLGVV